jgi:DNA end-binding protein Ku
MTLANQLIEQLSAKRFDPNDFADEFKARVEAAIQRKVQGRQVSFAQAPEPGSKGNVFDLMAALKASLNAREKTSPQSKDRKAPKRATTAPARKKGHR